MRNHLARFFSSIRSVNRDITVAILAQGTSWAVAFTQAFSNRGSIPRAAASQVVGISNCYVLCITLYVLHISHGLPMVYKYGRIRTDTDGYGRTQRDEDRYGIVYLKMKCISNPLWFKS